eukprot:Sdes_comp20858_c0_seq9m17701
MNASSLCDYNHYLLFDTNILLHQIDIVEHPSIQNCILLETVLEEVKNKSIEIYKRLRNICSQPSKKFFVFLNEHHKDTFLQRLASETPNDRNDRAIRQSVKWYNSHLLNEDDALSTLLVTNDKANSLLAQKDGIFSCTIREYIEGMKDDFPELLDMLNGENDDSDMKSEESDKINYPEYLSPSEIRTGIQSGTLLQGIFHRDKDFLEEASISNLSGSSDQKESVHLLILGFQNMNRSVDGDLVAVEILEESEWKIVGGVQRKTCRVVGVIKRNWRPYCGILLPNHHRQLSANSTNNSSLNCLFLPTDRSVPKIRIRTRQSKQLEHKRIIVSIDAWDRNSKYPRGHFVKCLGDIGEIATENEVLLIEHNVPYQPFSPKVLSEMPDQSWSLTEHDLSSRKDFRSLTVCSVDPPGCTDIDDALHCVQLSDGTYQVGVHIADVSHFVKPNSAVDLEAAHRGTTVYLTNKRIDMLPDILGSNLCSLRSHVDRLAFSCVWVLDEFANVLSVEFCKSIIQSKASLTYEEAQLKIEDERDFSDVAKSLRALNQLSTHLRKARMENGALELASPEVNFNIDNETNDPIDVKTKEIRSTNKMVEEFMLLANISVAQKIYQDFPQSACLRRHPTPPLSNFEPLIQACSSAGFQINAATSKQLADSLNEAVKPDSPYFNTMVRILATRCMMQAVYFSSGCFPFKEFHHYGLATPIYTHFTSPIRRYSDVIVHRQLAAVIGWEKYPDVSILDKNRIAELCENLNLRHRMAQFAARSSVNLYIQMFFKGKRVEEDAYVLRVRKNALVVIIPKYGIEAPLYLS